MALPLYLALTMAEFQNCSALPEHTAWMACHFSPYGLGLSNLPRYLPAGSMLILNDRTPPHGHSPDLIARQLEELVNKFRCGSVLLDFQRPDMPENMTVATAVVNALPCPVGISELYGKELNCPVFLPPVPPHIPVEEYLAPWQEREIWLEAALEGECISVSETGNVITPCIPGEQIAPVHIDKELCCHYQIEITEDNIQFHLFRTREDLDAVLLHAEQLGIRQAVGLFQELQ